MKATRTLSARNTLLDVLPKRQGDKVRSACEIVTVAFGDVLCEMDRPLTHVYFPLTAFISLVVPMHEYPPLEVSLIGNEGMLGGTLVLGMETAPARAVVQGPGTALRMSIARFNTVLLESPALAALLSRYVFVEVMQLAQAAACASFHEVSTRLVRRLLMSHDRAHADHFHLTHQFLADMLGVRRSAVTIAAGNLQKQGFIRYTRGEISILDRAGLEATSCECYGAMAGVYRQHFPDAARSR